MCASSERLFVNDAHTKQALAQVFVCAPAIPERLFIIDAHTKQALAQVFVCARAIQAFVRECYLKSVTYLRQYFGFALTFKQVI